MTSFADRLKEKLHKTSAGDRQKQQSKAQTFAAAVRARGYAAKDQLNSAYKASEKREKKAAEKPAQREKPRTNKIAAAMSETPRPKTVTPKQVQQMDATEIREVMKGVP